MNITEKKLENATVELQIEVPADRVEIEYKAVFDKIKNSAKLDGFRKGKAPLPMIESHYREKADQEVAGNLAKQIFFDAVTEKHLTPITEPRFDFEKINRGEIFSFKAVFETPPTVELGKYKEISAEEKVCEIKNSDVEDEINSMRERQSKVNPKEGGAVANSDFIKLKVKRIDDVEKDEIDNVEFREYSMVVGKSKDQYAFDKYVVDMKLDEEKEVTIKYPKDYFVSEYANQKVKFIIKISEINTMELPALDDEFAKLMNFETVEEFKTKTKENLENFVTERSKGGAKATILKTIVDSSKFEIPESLILNEMASLFQKTQQRFGYQFESIEQFASMMGMKVDEYRTKLHEEAEQSVKTTLILSEIAKKEELKVSEERYKEVIERIAKSNNKTIEEIEELVRKNNSRQNIEYELLLDSAMDTIYENAKIKKLKPVSFEEFVRAENNR